MDTPVKKLLRVAFGRWRIERCFEDGKGEVGLDHWEGRRWIGLKRHLILTNVSYLFLAKTCQRLRGRKLGSGPSARCVWPPTRSSKAGNSNRKLANDSTSGPPIAFTTTNDATLSPAPATREPLSANYTATASSSPTCPAATRTRASA